MKNFVRLTGLALVVAIFTSCSTSYDVNGQARQSIDPGAAAIGAVALGAIAYSVGKNQGKKSHHKHYKHHNYYKHKGHHPRYGYRY